MPIGQPTGSSAAVNKVWTVLRPTEQSGQAGVTGANQIVAQQLADRAAAVAVTQMWFRVGVQSGNLDAGIMSLSGTTLTRVASLGSTTCPAPGEVSANLTAGVTLDPAIVYYLVCGLDNTVARLYSATMSLNVQSSTRLGAPAYRFTGAFVIPATLDVSTAVAVDFWPVLAAK